MEEIIQAAALYKCALQENQAELLIPLVECKIIYVPNMPHSHRTVWIESNLLIFYSSIEEMADYLVVSTLPNKTRRGLSFITVDNYDNIRDRIIQIASENLQYNVNPGFCPIYFEIDPSILLRMMDLLVYI